MNQISPADLLPLGKVLRPHGSSGLIRIWAYSGVEDSFLEAGTVFLKSVSGEIQEYTVASVKPHKNIFLLRLKSLNTRDEAEQLRDCEIFVRKEALSREEDEYFWQELIGLRVFLDTGEYIGKIAQILATGANDIYVVKQGDKETYIPATYDVVKKISLKDNTMIVDAMEGLVELNEV